MNYTPSEQALLRHVYNRPIPTIVDLDAIPSWFNLEDAKTLADLGCIQYRKETTGSKECLKIWRNDSLPARREVLSFTGGQDPSENKEDSPESSGQRVKKDELRYKLIKAAEYWDNHPRATNEEAAKEVGLSPHTLAKRAKLLRGPRRREDPPEPDTWDHV